MKNFYKFLVALTLVMAVSGNAMADSSAGAAAIQGQAQGQQQGQTQSVSGSGNSSNANNSNSAVNDSGNSNVQFQNSFNGADPIRYLPIPTNVNVNTIGGPQLFGNANYSDHGPHFMSMMVLVNALNNADIDGVVTNGDDFQMTQQSMSIPTDQERSDAKSTPVKFFLNAGGDVLKTYPTFKTVSVNTLKATDNDKLNSATLAMALGKAAREAGANTVILVAEGSSKKLTSWGVGLGLSYNMASVGSKPSDSGQVGAGGTGWSYGEGGYESLPYLTALLGNMPK